ncbi:sensor histidine kinase [Microbacterium marinilacus]|nr:sensor histidine kinase [Microbacterium marinilacus]
MLRPVSPTQWLIDALVGTVFTLFAFAAQQSFGGEPSYVAGLVTLAMMVAALMLSRVSPPVSLAVAWIGALWQVGTGQTPLPANIAIFVVLFATAAYGTRLVFWAGFVSAGLGALVIAVYLVLPLSAVAVGAQDMGTALFSVISIFLAALFALLLSWTLGALTRSVLRSREGRRAQREAEARATAEEERGRIARDMHDVVAHSLAVVIAQADGARYAAAADPEAATQALSTISHTARAALTDVRVLLTQLRHSQAEGPQPSLADLEQLYAQVRAAGVDLRVDVDPAPAGDQPASVQLAVYRILQEALTNALRHGDGGPVDVGLSWWSDRVGLQVRNGIRADARPAEPGGHGLIGMRERAQLVGGHVEAAAEAGSWTVRGQLPIRPAE